MQRTCEPRIAAEVPDPAAIALPVDTVLFRCYGRQSMVHGNLAKSILDAGWGYLVQRLTHKAERAGRVVTLVDPRATSKTCSQCGHIFASLSLSDRWLDCACGLSLDRDHNAAI